MTPCNRSDRPSSGVSVVIVSWNTREMLLELLRELTAPQSTGTHELEVVVVDNHSSDGTVEAVRREFPTVNLIVNDENEGFAAGVNAGARAATQSLLLLLNADAVTSLASVEEVARYMDQNPRVDILGPKVVGADHRPQPSAWRDPSLPWLALEALGLAKFRVLDFAHYQRQSFGVPTEVDCVSGCAMVLRTSLMSELGGFDEDYFMYFEETDFCVRARRAGKQVHYTPVGHFVHQRGGASKSVRLRTFLDFRRSQILFFRKHHGVLAAIAARGLVALASALRAPPLLALALASNSTRASTQAKLHLHALRWLLNPYDGLVPKVDRSDDESEQRETAVAG